MGRYVQSIKQYDYQNIENKEIFIACCFNYCNEISSLFKNFNFYFTTAKEANLFYYMRIYAVTKKTTLFACMKHAVRIFFFNLNYLSNMQGTLNVIIVIMFE